MVQILTGDEKILEMDRDIAARSAVIQNLIQDIGEDVDIPIPIPNIRSEILTKIISYLTYHRDHPVSDEDKAKREKEWKSGRGKRQMGSCDFDKEFVEVDNDMLFSLVNAAYYLQIQDLLQLGCQACAELIKGKSSEEIRQIFKIKNDFTPEEEAEIKAETEKELKAIEDRQRVLARLEAARSKGTKKAGR